MKNLNKRKYIGVPSNNEIKEEYDYLTSLIKDIKTVEQAVEFSNNYPNIEVEINYEDIDGYLKNREIYNSLKENDVEDEWGNKKEIEVIRYEYKHIMLYVYFENDMPQIKEKVYLYSDDGLEIGEELYYNFNSTLENLYNKGLLEVNPDYLEN